MEQKIKITDGPSLLNLGLSLLQGAGFVASRNRLTVNFKTEKGELVEVAVSGLEKEKGNRQWWRIKGYVQGYNPIGTTLDDYEVTIRFDIKKRKGNIQSTKEK